MNTIRFKSVTQPNTRYTYGGSDRWNYRAVPVSSYAGWYDTLGDENIQHTPDRPIAIGALADWMNSLGLHLVDNPGDYHYEMATMVAIAGHTARQKDRNLFVYELANTPWTKHEGKNEHTSWYFSLELCKVSKGKEHDKRFFELRSDWQSSAFQGQHNSVVDRMLYLLRLADSHPWGGYTDEWLPKFADLCAMRDLISDQTEEYLDLSETSLYRGLNDHTKWNDLRRGLDFLKRAVQACDAMADARTYAGNIRPVPTSTLEVVAA